MLRKLTSTFYFQNTCTEVWNAVTNSRQNPGFTYKPLSDAEFDLAQAGLNGDQVLAKVTDMTPSVSCAYQLHTPKFTVHWNARFSLAGDNECKMVMTEIYDFPNHAIGQYLLSLLFVHQRQQHKAFYHEIEQRLKER